MTAGGVPGAVAPPLVRWDTRWKLAGVAGAALATALLTHPLPAAVALAGALSLLAAAGLTVRWVVGRLMILALAALPFLLLLPFTLGSDGEGWDLGFLRVSSRGLAAGAAVFFRCLAIGSLALLVVGTEPPHRVLAAAHALRLPGVLVLLAGLAHRYALQFGQELRRVRVALRTRGFRPAADRHGYRTLGYVVGAVLVRGADQAERVTAALRCRGFDGRFRTAVGFRTAGRDIIFFVALLAAAAALFVWDRLVLT